MNITSKNHSVTLKARKAITGYMFIIPWIIGFLLFTLYPVFFSIQLGFNEIKLDPSGMEMIWRGMSYYDMAWNVDTTFRIDLGNTVTLILFSLPVIIVFSLIISLLLNKKFPLRTFFRVIFFFPVVVMSGPAISELLSSHSLDFSEKAPTVFEFIKLLPAFIQKPTLFVLENLVLILWFSGVQILIFLAGLQKVSPDIYSAAEIDGAGAWEKFWKITLPFVSPMILLCTVYTIIDIANYANNAVNKKISESILSTSGLYSFSAAMSWIYFLTIMTILFVIYIIVLIFKGRTNT